MSAKSSTSANLMCIVDLTFSSGLSRPPMPTPVRVPTCNATVYSVRTFADLLARSRWLGYTEVVCLLAEDGQVQLPSVEYLLACVLALSTKRLLVGYDIPVQCQ